MYCVGSPTFLKMDCERFCRAGRGRARILPYGRLLQKWCFCFARGLQLQLQKNNRCAGPKHDRQGR